MPLNFKCFRKVLCCCCCKPPREEVPQVSLHYINYNLESRTVNVQVNASRRSFQLPSELLELNIAPVQKVKWKFNNKSGYIYPNQQTSNSRVKMTN